MQDKAKVQLATALAATLGFAIHSSAGATEGLSLQLSNSEKQSPFYIASNDTDSSSKGKDGSCKGKEKKCMFKKKKSKGASASDKGKEGSCKGKDGSCKTQDQSK